MCALLWETRQNEDMVDVEQDPRVERSRRVILEAVLEELGAVGYGALTIEAVAARDPRHLQGADPRAR